MPECDLVGILMESVYDRVADRHPDFEPRIFYGYVPFVSIRYVRIAVDDLHVYFQCDRIEITGRRFEHSDPSFPDAFLTHLDEVLAGLAGLAVASRKIEMKND